MFSSKIKKNIDIFWWKKKISRAMRMIKGTGEKTMEMIQIHILDMAPSRRKKTDPWSKQSTST